MDDNCAAFEAVEEMGKQRKRDDAAFIEKLDALIRLAQDLREQATRYMLPKGK